jgi:solute carrier family 25 oxoglutarate transporter 11
MLVTYDETKERLTKAFPALGAKSIMALASMTSACVTSTCSLPFDNIKTKLQKMKKDKEGNFPYKGFMDCVKKTAANEGITGFWAGLPTYYFRVGPHTIITLLTSEFLRK